MHVWVSTCVTNNYLKGKMINFWKNKEFSKLSESFVLNPLKQLQFPFSNWVLCKK